MIRVLRVIEYTYPDAQTYYEDRQRWTVSATYRGVGFQSSVVSETVVEDATETNSETS